MMDTVTVKALRRAWVHASGLCGQNHSARSALASAGWLSANGGVDPYLSVRCRYEDLKRDQLDALIADDTVRLSPAAHGDLMIVPEDDCQLALSLSQLLAGSYFESAQELLSVPTSELEKGATVVLELLQESPLTTKGLFATVPTGVVRSLGEEGRRRGYPSTLMMVIKFLEAQGLVGVWPEGDRLDGVLHRWDLLEPKVEIIRDPSLVIRRLILRYIGLSGASTVSGFSNWSGLSLEQSKSGFDKLGLHPFRVEGRGVVYADERTADQLLKGVPQVPKSLALPLEDPLFCYRGGLSALLDQAHHNIRVTVSGKGEVALGDLHGAPLRPILIEGSLGGFWEYDDEEQGISYAMFDRLRGGDLRRLESELSALAEWLFNSFGHAKAHRSESARSRGERLRSVQALKRV